MPSFLKSNAIRILELCAVAGVFVAAATSRSSVVRASEASQGRFKALSQAIDARATAMEALAAKSSELTRTEQQALERLDESDSIADLSVGCAEPVPAYKFGVGILQIAGVPMNRGDDTLRFAQNQITRLRTLFASNSVPIWADHLSQYKGRGAEPIRRVILNDIDPGAGAEMCSWLRCQRWTGGCAFIDERGETNTQSGSPEYPPTEDLYQLWKVSSLDQRAPSIPKL